jgi:hypothetical protein
MVPARSRAVSLLLAVALAATSSACVAAAAAGAGAAIYLTSRGAESIVGAPIDELERRARAVLAAEKVEVTGFLTEKGGARRELRGTKGDLEISVSMEQQGDETTRAEVTARKNLAVWDKPYAEQVLGKIVKQG